MFRFRALASGSSGNAYLLQTARARLLFDAGLRLPTLLKYLAAEGVELAELDGVLISHEHRDHCAAAYDLAQRGVPIWANPPVLTATGVSGLDAACCLDVGTSTRFGDVTVTPFDVSHDAARPVGFLIDADGRHIVIATDLGEASDDLASAVSIADLVVLEANHDPVMLRSGRYPPHLQRRVAGRTGHLANHQAGDILARHAGGDHVEAWLAHLSRNNNTPVLALRTVGAALKVAGLGALRVAVAKRDRPSLSWNGMMRPTQLALFPDPS